MTHIDHETGTEFHDTISGVCKDCGNGTLNNDLNPAFDLDLEEGLYPVCLRCGSTHVDIL